MAISENDSLAISKNALVQLAFNRLSNEGLLVFKYSMDDLSPSFEADRLLKELCADTKKILLANSALEGDIGLTIVCNPEYSRMILDGTVFKS